MRPIRLELEAFSAFRDPVEVDFTGVDLFALTGPTGSGKSSVIDAIVFALYGSVPRYDDRRLVAPVITQGENEARVRLDFSVGDRRYTAVRVVRRTKTGATTKEARLERDDGEILAGNEKEVGIAVESLLGLSFDHFTKCVVLPQGEFARFLHDKPERRQDLLVSLLDLSIYERMARLPRAREATAKARTEFAEARLADLAFASGDAKEVADARVAALEALLASVEADLSRLDALAQAAAAARTASAEAAARASDLAALAVPDGVADLTTSLARAEAAAVAASATESAASVATEQAERTLLVLPARSVLEAAEVAHAQRAAHLSQRDKGLAVLAERVDEEAKAQAALAGAEERVAAAAEALEQAQWQHRAHDLAGRLVPGEPCPVCEQLVSALPSATRPSDLDAARVAKRDADKQVEQARHELEAIRRERARVETKLASIDTQLDVLAPVVAAWPDAAALAGALGEVVAAEASVEGARVAERAARAARVQASEALAKQRSLEVTASRAFDAARDRVARWGAPACAGLDLESEWRALAAWAAAEAPRAEAAAVEAAAAATALDDEGSALDADVRTRCSALGVEVAAPAPARDAVVEAFAEARSFAARVVAALAEAETRRGEIAESQRDAQVAGALARHLGATGFEKWVLDEALGRLVEGATELLLALSGGQYSMTLEERTSNFMVIDHRNADERRSARTLSGGETFLASLALALALADQLTLLAARGGALLESIFLDEGFGTLDPDTLDVVAAAIEELGATGRMVGLISHVPELAERVPVRFEVAKAGLTSTVTRR